MLEVQKTIKIFSDESSAAHQSLKPKQIELENTLQFLAQA
jgi:hypothetical protein